MSWHSSEEAQDRQIGRQGKYKSKCNKKQLITERSRRLSQANGSVKSTVARELEEVHGCARYMANWQALSLGCQCETESIIADQCLIKCMLCPTCRCAAGLCAGRRAPERPARVRQHQVH